MLHANGYWAGAVWAAALVWSSVALAGDAPGRGPVVMELYTSQGCASCPTADAVLRDMSARDDILALSLHVDYWDYIGWKDSFAKPQFTKRQKAYAVAQDRRMIYTPQVIVDGTSDVVGNEPMNLAGVIERQKEIPALAAIAVQVKGADDYLVDLVPLIKAAPEALVFLVRYIPSQTVAITRGENAGRTVEYTNIVTSLDPIAEWPGTMAQQIPISVDGPDKAAVIVQERGYGLVLAAARLR